ncbi:hypothetical protein [Streptomyces roseus]|nr:hypothetical protein [Streptomyces roseus]
MEGGFLYQRWEEEALKARHGSWHEAATWIKTDPPCSADSASSS